MIAAYLTRGYWLPEPVDICFDGNAEASLRELFPPHMGETDVLFAFDQSGSMGTVIDGAKMDAKKLMRSVAARLGSERFGLAGFSDYIDFPYQLYQPLTDDYDLVQSEIDELTLAHGGDTPEAYGRLMYESYTDPEIGWREEARRYLVIFGDSYPHDPDAGRDGILGTSDDLILADILAKTEANQITVIYVANPEISDDIFAEWEEWLDAIAGKANRCDNP